MNSTPDLQNILDDPSVILYEDIKETNNTLLITFGGLRGGLSMPMFEFYSVTNALSCSRLLVRDIHQVWYQNGLPEMGDNIEDIAKTLQKRIHELSPDRVLCIGNSAGGYAALLFGHMLQVDMVLSFAPQTYLTWWMRLKTGDHRWQDRINYLWQTNQSAKSYRNLRHILKSSNKVTKFHVFYSPEMKLDQLHALHIRNCPNVVLHSYPEGGHALIKLLKDQGKLLPLLESALDGDLNQVTTHKEKSR